MFREPLLRKGQITVASVVTTVLMQLSSRTFSKVSAPSTYRIIPALPRSNVHTIASTRQMKYCTSFGFQEYRWSELSLLSQIYLCASGASFWVCTYVGIKRGVSLLVSRSTHGVRRAERVKEGSRLGARWVFQAEHLDLSSYSAVLHASSQFADRE